MRHWLIAVGRKLASLIPVAKATGEGIREAAEPTLGAATERLNDSIDRAAQHGHELLDESETRARRVVEDLDQRLTVQRQRTESACHRITRRLAWRLVWAGLILLVAAGCVAGLAAWLYRQLP